MPFQDVGIPCSIQETSALISMSSKSTLCLKPSMLVDKIYCLWYDKGHYYYNTLLSQAFCIGKMQIIIYWPKFMYRITINRKTNKTHNKMKMSCVYVHVCVCVSVWVCWCDVLVFLSTFVLFWAKIFGSLNILQR